MSQKTEWEKFFSDNAATEWYPSESVVRFFCSYKKRYGTQNVRVLDLGCGNGRHVYFLAKEGFVVYGIDLSERAVTLAEAWIKKDGLCAEDLRSGDITGTLPYSDGFFDIVLSYGVLDHVPLPHARGAVTEIGRILKPGGMCIVKLESNTSGVFETERTYAKNEVVLDKHVERGIIQHFFDKEEVSNLMKDFECIKAFREDSRTFDNLDANYQSRWIFIGKKSKD